MVKVAIGSLFALAVMAGVARADCGAGSLRGDYSFTVHGEALSADGTTVTGLIDGVGLIEFDGQGKLVQEDFVVKGGTEVPGGATNASGFHTGEQGTYTVNADCTGAAHIVLGPGNERFLALVITNGGRSAHAIVSAALVGGQTALLQVYSDFEKLDPR